MNLIDMLSKDPPSSLYNPELEENIQNNEISMVFLLARVKITLYLIITATATSTTTTTTSTSTSTTAILLV